MKHPCKCYPCEYERKGAWASGLVTGAAVIFVAAIVAGGCSGSVDAAELAGTWRTTYSHPALCPLDLERWDLLELGSGYDFEARSSSGAELAHGLWTQRVAEDGTPIAVLAPAPGTYPATLTIADGIHLGGLITVDVPGDVCSYPLVMERP